MPGARLMCFLISLSASLFRFGRVCLLFLVGMAGAWMPVPLVAQAAPHLADFSFGLTEEEMRFRLVSPCPQGLCGEVRFGGCEWGGAFAMEDGRLAGITLFGPSQRGYAEAAFRGVADSPYIVYRAITGQDVFDFAQQTAQGQSPAESQRLFVEFMREHGQVEDAYAIFLYTDERTYASLVAEAAAEIRSAGADAEKTVRNAPAGRLAGRAEKAARERTAKGRAADETAAEGTAAEEEAASPLEETNADVALSMPEEEWSDQRVGCALIMETEGITFMVMPWADFQDVIADRAAHVQQPEKGGKVTALPRR